MIKTALTSALMVSVFIQNSEGAELLPRSLQAMEHTLLPAATQLIPALSAATSNRFSGTRPMALGGFNQFPSRRYYSSTRATQAQRSDRPKFEISHQPAVGKLRFAALPFVMVEEQFKVARLTFGRFTGFMNPGFHFLIPFVHRVQPISMKRVIATIPLQNATTTDGTEVDVAGTFVYHVTDPYKAAFSGQNLEPEIISLASGTLRTSLGQMTLAAAITGGRELIVNRILAAVHENEAKWGAKLDDIEIIALEPVPEVAHVMNMQKEAESKEKVAKHDAQAAKTTKTLNAEADKLVVVTAADAKLEAAAREAEAVVIAAKAKADAVVIEQEAYSKALAKMAETLKNNPEVREYLFTKMGAEAWEKAASKGTTFVVDPGVAQGFLTPFVTKALEKFRPGGLPQ